MVSIVSSDAALCASDASLCVPAESVGAFGLLMWIIDLWLLVTVSLTILFCFWMAFGRPEKPGWRQKFVTVAGWGAGMFALTAIVTFAGMTFAVWLR